MLHIPIDRRKRNKRRRFLVLFAFLVLAPAFFLCLSISFVREDPKTLVSVIGKTLHGLPISVRRFGVDGPIRIVVVCGMHGIYESGSVALADFLADGCEEDAPPVSLSLIRNLNPDSELEPPTEGGWARRFNGNDTVLDPKGRKVGVDLNRNWGTKNWIRDISYAAGSPMRNAGGSRPFSEPETRALRDFLLGLRRSGKRVFVISFHNRVGNTGRGGTVEPALGPSGDSIGASGKAAAAYARSMSYKVVNEWTDYPITGDLMAWLGENGFEGFEAEMSGLERDAAIENETAVYELVSLFPSIFASVPFKP